MAKVNKVSKASNAVATVATTAETVATVAETVATVATTAETVATVAKPCKYSKFAAENAELASIAAIIAVKHKSALWAMPTHGTAAKGVAGTACQLWLAAYADNGNQTPPASALASAVLALCTKHQTVKGGKGQNYSSVSSAVAQGQVNAIGVVWALGYLCYGGKKTNGKISLV